MPEHQPCDERSPRSCETMVNQLRVAVFGNGHPEHSLLVRMERVEQRLRAIQKLSLATVCGVWALVVKFVSAWIDAFVGA